MSNENICNTLFNKCITDKSAEFKILSGTYKYYSTNNEQVLNCINTLEKCLILCDNNPPISFLNNLKELYKHLR